MVAVGTRTLSITQPPFRPLDHLRDGSPHLYLCLSSDHKAIGWIPENCAREMPKTWVDSDRINRKDSGMEEENEIAVHQSLRSPSIPFSVRLEKSWFLCGPTRGGGRGSFQTPKTYQERNSPQHSGIPRDTWNMRSSCKSEQKYTVGPRESHGEHRDRFPQAFAGRE